MMSAKVKEAIEHVRIAERHLKTSLLRWKPDFDSAADEYTLAAQCYRIARDTVKSKECHLKASEYYKKNKSFFHAAKALENTILVCKDTATAEEIFDLATEASSLYQQHGSGDSAASILDKSAKIIEERAPKNAILLYQQAAEVSSSESSQHQGMEYVSKASRLLVKMRMYDEAADSIRQEISFNLEAGNTGNVGRLTVAAVLVHIARGDCVAARKTFQEWGMSNCEQSECQTIESMITAFEEDDRDNAMRALNSPFIKSMDVEYSRLARAVLPSPARRSDVTPFVAHEMATSRFEDIEESPYETVTCGKKDEAGTSGSLC